MSSEKLNEEYEHMEHIKQLSDEKRNEDRLSEDELRLKYDYFSMTER